MKFYIYLIILIICIGIALGASLSEDTFKLEYKLSETRRSTNFNSTYSLTSNLRAGTNPEVLEENTYRVDITPTNKPVRVIDSNNLFNFKILTTEVVWAALSLILNNSYGTIDFQALLDISNQTILDLDENVNISYNYLRLNATALPQLNKSVRLTISNLTFSSIRILKNGEDCRDCDIVSYSDGDVIFNAPGFTYYQAAEGAVPALKVSKNVFIKNTTMSVNGLSYEGVYPSNIKIDIGYDGDNEFSYSGTLNSKQTFTNFTDELNSILLNCDCAGCSLSRLTCIIQINVTSDTKGVVVLSDLNISQDIKNATWPQESSYDLIDLDDYFYDENNLTLVYNHTNLDHINVSIEDGYVILTPETGWYGVEYVYFNASDLDYTIHSNRVKLNVTAAACGDGVCNGDEDCSNCPGDCGQCVSPPGGARGGPGYTRAPDFSVEPDLIKVLIPQGGIEKRELLIKNIGPVFLYFTLDIKDLSEVLFISESSFGLSPGEEKRINLNFFARENQAIDTYLGNIIISAGQLSKFVGVIVEVRERKALFDVSVKVLKDKVEQGTDVSAQLTLLNLGELKPVDVFLYYAIKDMNGNVINFRDETLAVWDESYNIRTLKVPWGTTPGRYVFYGKLTYDDKIVTGSDVFNVVEVVKKPPVKIRWIDYLLGLIILIILILIGYMYYKYKKKIKERKLEKEKDRELKLKEKELKIEEELLKSGKETEMLLKEIELFGSRKGYNKLKKYIKNELNRGYSEKQIKEALFKRGWDKGQINFAFEKVKSE